MFGSRIARTLRVLALTVLAAGVVVVAGAAPVGAQASRDIVDTAVAAGQFGTLARALTAADLVSTLKGAGPFTVFAPTDAAFNKIPAATLNGLLANQAQLRQVLLYHVVSGRVMAADVSRMTSANTVQGSPVRIAVSGSTVRINDATVTQADVAASNGVIHVIDTVLMPPSMSGATAGSGTMPRTGEEGVATLPLAVLGGLAGLALLAGVALRRRIN